ncbi:hypothetical protein KP509_34G069900 [Ceratopteris richardii]|nr:hypothetical protein KP509_34G069900 [Ceratopteris richardii]
MFVKCGELKKAQHVFDEFVDKNVVLWNSLLSGYALHGHNKEALACFEQMQRVSCLPNTVTYICILKACSSMRDLKKGQKIHSQIVNEGFLEKDTLMYSVLMDMYSKCKALDEVQELFNKIPVQSTDSWTALICAYVQCQCYEEALSSFEQMQQGGFSPNIATLTSIFKACGLLGCLEKGIEIHLHLVRIQWLEESIVASNALIDMYAKCGALSKAEEVFVKLPAPNLITWTELIAGCVNYGYGYDALIYSERLQLCGFSPDSVTYACILKACGNTEALERGKRIHARLVKDHALEEDPIIASSLINMYANCGALKNAQGVFGKLTTLDVVTWNVLIKGYVENGHHDLSFSCFKQMKEKGPLPNGTTVVCLLESCGVTGDLDKAEEVYAQVIRQNLLENDLLVGNSVVNVYVQCGDLQRAQEVFLALPAWNIISWNVLIAGYAEHGYSKISLYYYEQMKLAGFSPNTITIACTLKACGNILALDNGENIHAQVAKQVCIQSDDDMVINALVDMYARCGAHKRALQLHYQKPFQDATPWNAMISGCILHGQEEEAFNYFEQMQVQGYTPDEITFACILKACGSRGSVFKGQEIHSQVIQKGVSKLSMVVGTALVVMYSKCGMLMESQYLFDRLPIQDVVSWTALMTGYAAMGKDDTVLKIFDDMLLDGIHPNPVTFTAVLQVCRRRGLVQTAEYYFEIMRTSYQLDPDLEHYICMVDLYSASGHLDKAIALVRKVSDPTLCHTLLDACKKQGAAKIGSWSFQQM